MLTADIIALLSTAGGGGGGAADFLRGL